MEDTFFEHGVISSAHKLASEAGLEVLREGGNAIDAIVTTSLTLSAILPAFSGIGGGGFLMVRQASEDKTTFIDYREVAPANSRPDMFQTDNAETARNSVGHLAVAVPGTVMGLAYALEKYGTIHLSRALKRGIEHASRGTPVTRTLKRATDYNVEKLRRFSYSASVFLREGSAPEPGTQISFPELALTYQKIARNGPEEFYTGTIAHAILDEIEKHGGVLKENDLAKYEPVERKPLRFDFDGCEFYLAPPPSAAGIQIAQCLQMLKDKGQYFGSSEHNSYNYLLIMSKILGATFADRTKNLADPDYFPVDVQKLLSREHVSSITPKIGSLDSDTGRSTTHMCAADKEGNVAALTESIECFYGSGVAVPKTGVLLNDTMHDFDTSPASPNSVSPGKTPLSSMSPMIVCRDSKPFLTCGSAGGPRIISATLQTTLNVILFGKGIQDAIDAARFHYQGTKFIVESRVNPAVREKLRQDGYDIDLMPEYDLALGGVQGIKFDRSGRMSGGADPRREAFASGF